MSSTARDCVRATEQTVQHFAHPERICAEALGREPLHLPVAGTHVVVRADAHDSKHDIPGRIDVSVL
jgi:hypothetical protein